MPIGLAHYLWILISSQLLRSVLLRPDSGTPIDSADCIASLDDAHVFQLLSFNHGTSIRIYKFNFGAISHCSRKRTESFIRLLYLMPFHGELIKYLKIVLILSHLIERGCKFVIE